MYSTCCHKNLFLFVSLVLLCTAFSKIEYGRKYKDCPERWEAGEKEPGVYIIHPNGTFPVKVYCGHSVNGSYTVIQRRLNGQINFYTTWQYYKLGFGNPQGDYWAGLDAIHALTYNGNNILRIEMQSWNGLNRYIQYQHFLVDSETNYYKMYVSGASGQVTDDLSFNNGMYFYTPDRPDANNCAGHQKAGWWYNYCTYSHPNGIYYIGGPYTPTGGFYDGIYWKDWLGYGYSLRFISLTLYKY